MRCLLVGALEVEARRVLARVDLAVAHLEVVEPVGDLLPHGLARVERVARLVDVGELHGVAELERARVGGLLAGDHAKQRRLAGAVGADHADDAGARQVEGRGLDQQPLAEALAQVASTRQHLLAQARARRDVDLDLVELDVALLGDQLLVARQTRLGLRALPLGFVRTHSSSAAIVRSRPFSERSSWARRACFCSSQARVVALVGDAPAAVELEDPAGDVVEEVAVVRDGDDRALVLGEVLLEPRHRLGVEVVGGLVQQQQVGRAQQQPAERHAAALAAGELADVGVGRGQAQRVHRVFQAACRGSRRRRRRSCAWMLAELLGRLLGVVGGQLVEAVEQRLGLGDAVLDVALARPCSRPAGAPARASRRSPPARARLAAVLLIDPGHDPQQRGLARAVVAEHADLRARVEAPA